MFVIIESIIQSLYLQITEIWYVIIIHIYYKILLLRVILQIFLINFNITNDLGIVSF